MDEITNGIYAALWRSYRENNCNTYLISEGDVNILIDPGHYHLTGHWQRGLEGRKLSPQDIDVVIVTMVIPIMWRVSGGSHRLPK